MSEPAPTAVDGVDTLPTRAPAMAAGSSAYRPTNQLAIISFVFSFLVPLAGIVCGHIALMQIRRTGEEGHGLALAGTVIGYVLSGLIVLLIIGYVVFIVLFVTLFAGFTHAATVFPSALATP